MFRSFRRGWRFFVQVLVMARNDPDLIKPSIYGFFVNAIITVVTLIPLAALWFLFGNVPILRWLPYLAGALLIFVEYVVSYIFAGMTAYLVYGYISEGDGRMDHAWAIVKRDIRDLMTLAAVSTVVKLIENFLRGQGRRRGVGSLIAGVLANILQVVWTTASYFVLPAMVIEDLNLKDGLKRATQIIKDNLLLVAISEIGVGAITGLIGFVGIMLSIGIAVSVAGALSVIGPAGLVSGIILAIIIVGLMVGFINIFTSYITTAYHTTMFIWAISAEKAVSEGRSMESAAMPEMVAAVMG